MSAGELRPPVSARDHVQGPADAPVTLVEYGDYECPSCGQAYPVVKRLQARLGPRMRFVFRNFPLTEVHRHALQAAVAAESVAEDAGPEAFWVMHDLIYEHQREREAVFSEEGLVRLAEEAGADPEVVLADLRGDRLEGRVREDFMGGVRSGVNGTPTFFINGRRHDGSWDEESLAEALLAQGAGVGGRR